MFNIFKYGNFIQRNFRNNQSKYNIRNLDFLKNAKTFSNEALSTEKIAADEINIQNFSEKSITKRFYQSDNIEKNNGYDLWSNHNNMLNVLYREKRTFNKYKNLYINDYYQKSSDSHEDFLSFDKIS